MVTHSDTYIPGGNKEKQSGVAAALLTNGCTELNHAKRLHSTAPDPLLTST